MIFAEKVYHILAWWMDPSLQVRGLSIRNSSRKILISEKLTMLSFWIKENLFKLLAMNILRFLIEIRDFMMSTMNILKELEEIGIIHDLRVCIPTRPQNPLADQFWSTWAWWTWSWTFPAGCPCIFIQGVKEEPFQFYHVNHLMSFYHLHKTLLWFWLKIKECLCKIYILYPVCGAIWTIWWKSYFKSRWIINGNLWYLSTF